MSGKLIVIEGLDCSGKETQTNLIKEWLCDLGYNVVKFSFPNYDSATGKIIAGSYLGKEGYGEQLFKEGAFNVDPYCSALLYALDRKYNIKEIEKYINDGYIVILDRYIDSNIAYQGAKVNEEEFDNVINFIEKLEYDLLKMPKPDFVAFLHLSYDNVQKLLKNRKEKADAIERDSVYLKKAEAVYLKTMSKNNATIIECCVDDRILSIEEINNQLKENMKNIF